MRQLGWMKHTDDRSAYSGLHAIMYGPFVMAGLSMGDWKLGHVEGNLSKWIHPVPAAYNSQLSTFSQDHGQSTNPLFLACDNSTAFMSSAPEDGTDLSGFATFRVAAPIGSFAHEKRVVSLELFSQPGSFLKHNGNDKLISAGPPNCLLHETGKMPLGDCPAKESVFFYLPGLTGESGTVSFEAASQPGCFLSSSKTASGVFLRCKTSKSGSISAARSTFSVRQGVAASHPFSFIAEGKHRNFLLAPLNSLRDESYTIYFDIDTTTLRAIS